MSEEGQATISVLDTSTQQIVETPVPSHQPASEGSEGAPPAQNVPAESGAQDAEPTSVEDGGEPEQPRQGKNRYARRIDELTREKEQEKREKLELMQTLKQITQRGEQQQPQQPQVTSKYANEPGFDPKDPEPSKDDYDEWPAYDDARRRWLTRLEVRTQNIAQARESRRQQAIQSVMHQTAQIAQHYNQTAQNWDKQHPEFYDKVESLRGISAEANPAMTRAIFTSSNPPAVLDALASVPEAAHRIAQMEPEQQIRYIAMIEARLGMQHAQVSNAPPVGRPVGSTTATSRSAYKDDYTPAQHRAWKKANGYT